MWKYNFLFNFALQQTMQKTVVKYIVIALLLMTYINRGLFVSGAYEMENSGFEETNSAIELLINLVTGESNDIDEDGNLQTYCNFAKIVHHDFTQHLVQCLELINPLSKNIEKLSFPWSKNLPLKGFRFQIDHPPQI